MTPILYMQPEGQFFKPHLFSFTERQHNRDKRPSIHWYIPQMPPQPAADQDEVNSWELHQGLPWGRVGIQIFEPPPVSQSVHLQEAESESEVECEPHGCDTGGKHKPGQRKQHKPQLSECAGIPKFISNYAKRVHASSNFFFKKNETTKTSRVA